MLRVLPQRSVAEPPGLGPSQIEDVPIFKACFMMAIPLEKVSNISENQCPREAACHYRSKRLWEKRDINDVRLLATERLVAGGCRCLRKTPNKWQGEINVVCRFAQIVDMLGIAIATSQKYHRREQCATTSAANMSSTCIEWI